MQLEPPVRFPKHRQVCKPRGPYRSTNTQLTICCPANMCFKMNRHHILDSIFGAVALGKKLIRSLASFRLITTTPGLPIETKDSYPSTNIYYQHHDMSLALSQLYAYVKAKGLFNVVLAFSQCTALAATCLVRHSEQQLSKPSPFECTICFCWPKGN